MARATTLQTEQDDFEEVKVPEVKVDAVTEIFNQVVADITSAEPALQEPASAFEKSEAEDASENKKNKRISKAERQQRRSEVPKIPVKPVPTTHVDLTSEDTPQPAKNNPVPPQKAVSLPF